ncbi:uncharacterized protein LOC129131894 isoform X2 [Agelaius phoeniceus]|uniref:uncharacterized protein LOC129131894 isoform X2 n=1 Tax=Agelaius phoeniceus TaxID=39638 RepID=UPI004054D7FE
MKKKRIVNHQRERQAVVVALWKLGRQRRLLRKRPSFSRCQNHGNFIVSQATSLGALCLNSIKKLLRILPHLFQLTFPHSIHREIILEKENTDNHAVNSSSENTDDQKTGVGRKKFSLFKRKPLMSQKNVCSRKEDSSEKPLQSEEKEKEDLTGESNKDENQNHTLENSSETVTNQDRRMKVNTCTLL